MTARRLTDILIAGVGLVFLAPGMMFVALLVLLLDGRPILFVQERSGRQGSIFRLLKFRTMSDRRGPDGRLLPDNQRMTAIGRISRALRIDELPQLWNVLVGDMSLVGPRPLLPVTIAAAGDSGKVRGMLRPGMTGWAQVSGNALLSEQDKLALDIWYVDHHSPLLDLRIIGRTLLVVLFGERLDLRAIRRAHAGSSHRRG